MWNWTDNNYYQVKIEEVVESLTTQDDKLQWFLDTTEYSLFVELQENIAYENSCIEALNIVYTRINNILKYWFFSNKNFIHILGRVTELQERPFGKMYSTYPTEYDNIYDECIRIESLLSIFNTYRIHIELLIEEIEELLEDGIDHPLLDYLHHLSKLYAYFFFKYMNSSVSCSTQESLQQSYQSMINNLISIQHNNTHIRSLLNTPQGEKLMNTIFDIDFLSPWNSITHQQWLYIFLSHLYFIMWRFELDAHISLLHHKIDKDLTISDTINEYNKIKHISQRSILFLSDQLKSLYIDESYEEKINYILSNIYKMIKNHSQQEVNTFHELQKLLLA